jgi:hypothetical protein
MSKDSIINHYKVSGEEIHNIIGAIEEICVNVPKPQLVIACLSLALTENYPNISSEDKVDGVNEISKYICLWVDSKIAKDNERVETIN